MAVQRLVSSTEVGARVYRRREAVPAHGLQGVHQCMSDRSETDDETRTRSKTVTIATCAPVEIADYLRIVGASRYARPSVMYARLISRFLERRPWDQGMAWARPRAAGHDERGHQWVRVSCRIGRDLARRVDVVCREHGISRSALMLTVIMWLVRVVHPPGGIKPTSDA